MGGTVALLLAAGSGDRLRRRAKAFVELGGVPMFLRSYRAMAVCGRIDRVVVVVPPDYVELAARWTETGAPIPVAVCRGGSSRQESVELGLRAVADGPDRIVCHDAARPFATPGLYVRVIDALARAQGAVPIISSPDTVKRVRDGLVMETVPRHEVGLVQTPQAFLAEALRDSHRRAAETGFSGTDDAMLLEAAGYEVAAVEGEPSNFKITTPDDLRRAELFLAERGGERAVGAPTGGRREAHR